VNTLWIWRAGRKKPVYIPPPPGVAPPHHTLTPPALARKLSFQCRCARVSQKLNSLILFPVKNTISCYAMTRVWTSLMTMWEVREWYPNVPVLWFLVNDQRDELIPFYVFIFIYNSLHVSSTSCSSSGEREIVSIQPVVTVTLCWWPCRVQVGSDSENSDCYQRLYWYNLSLLMMSTRCSKHIESYK
jgi:hypothetical protein